ncbi:hypothetical protein FHG87_016471 [Trinorchestia longiramus]|nr:hypothetical protein FHG87_016471 [Trinorchestia longiramus]
MVPCSAHLLLGVLVLLCLWSSTCSLPDDTSVSASVSMSKPSKESNSAENFIRPLENMADRLLKSETVGVVDSITAGAIGALTRLVDGAGLAMVDIIDNLPRTIDNVATTVDGVVQTVDQLGRDVAVIVTAPARVVLTSLNPNATRPFSAERRNSRRSSPTERLIDRLRGRRERRREILRNFFDLEDPYQQHPNDNNVITDSVSTASGERRTIRRTNTPRTPPHGTVPAPNGGLRSLLNIFRPPLNRSNGVERVTAANSIARALGRSLFATQASLRQAEQSSGSKERDSKTRPESQERRQSVFERNFEASKTQASINRLEKEVGSFLGRLLGTIYRNADPIDDSLSKGIRQVLGAPPEGNRPSPSTSPSSSSSAEGVNSSAPLTSTTTKSPFKFRLSFDDLDPAPARHAALLGP